MSYEYWRVDIPEALKFSQLHSCNQKPLTDLYTLELVFQLSYRLLSRN